ncbi:hypothetical protein J2Z69_000801 [Paenibacillus shirakamiensis]|uniref:LysM domain-containing protein n=1 Tax=Paenibacillus shirakamiensis TaxID=1265935 RepID=A0ABS4JDH8_9BACL|nr:LysM peptidoglycan-binding domain-containing protein [Paenibacillus shirakamiensis]MBP1999782.1 hypothetical protein [Paenibacillus shirakamiensis]
MLKYSSYQSIHATVPNPNKLSNNQLSNNQLSNMNLKKYTNLLEAKGIRRLTVIIFMIVITCTGMITAFASSESGHTPNMNYIIQSGDTLWSIASANKPDGADIRSYIHRIMKENSMSISNLKAGEVISLPID